MSCGQTKNVLGLSPINFISLKKLMTLFQKDSCSRIHLFLEEIVIHQKVFINKREYSIFIIITNPYSLVRVSQVNQLYFIAYLYFINIIL